MTAAGSVVATTEPSSRQTTSGRPAIGHERDADHRGADTTVATTASIEDWSGVLEHPPHVDGDRALEDQQRQENVDEGLRARPAGRRTIAAKSPKRAATGVCTRTIDTAPIATPMTARSTTGASLRRTATG